MTAADAAGSAGSADAVGSLGAPPQWPATTASVRLHDLFLRFNRWAVPVLRSPVGALFMNPLAGYAMLLRTRGRRSGAPRYAPLNYAIVDGAVYCLAGFGRRTHWFRNLCAEPRVAVRLPLRWVDGVAEEVMDPAERLRAVRAVLHGAGFAGFLVGANPWSVPDDVLLAKTAGLPVVRVRRVDGGPIVAGPADPGGWLWVPVVGAQLWFSRWLRRRLAGRR